MNSYCIVRAVDSKALCWSLSTGTYWANQGDQHEVHFGPVGSGYIVALLNATGLNVSSVDTSTVIWGDPHL
jgi:hypothetical protein